MNDRQPRTFAAGETVCWRQISGLDILMRPVYGDWATGEFVGIDDSGLALVRRLPDRTVVLIDPAKLS